MIPVSIVMRFKRILQHSWLNEAATQRALPPDLLERLRQRVAASEQRHTGEIRIYVETSLPFSYLRRSESTADLTRQRALSEFGKLRVWDTANNNGVLIYLLLAEHAIEIVADRGLNALMAPQDWQVMVLRMRTAFQKLQYEEGLTQAVAEISTLLVQYFPLHAGEANPNELPDTPSVN